MPAFLAGSKNMFWNRNNKKANQIIEKHQNTIDELQVEIDTLREEKVKLKDDLSDAKLELKEVKANNKMEEENLKHLIAKKEDQLQMDYKRKCDENEIKYAKQEIELQRKKFEEIGTVRDEYKLKLENQLKSETNNIKDMYGQILDTLRDVTPKLKGKVNA